VPVLLGVTRDSVMRLDEETKEILKIWPLTTLRRWAASPNSFTLDFGDYADAYYSVQTSEGEQISQLIAGYIDIILKKRKEMSKATEEDEEQVAIAEETVRPAKASAITTQSNRVGRAVEVEVATAGVVSDDDGRTGARNAIKKKFVARGTEHGVSQYNNTTGGAQAALLQYIGNGYAAVNAATSDLSVAAIPPPIGSCEHCFIDANV
jgi:talin